MILMLYTAISRHWYSTERSSKRKRTYNCLSKNLFEMSESTNIRGSSTLSLNHLLKYEGTDESSWSNSLAYSQNSRKSSTSYHSRAQNLQVHVSGSPNPCWKSTILPILGSSWRLITQQLRNEEFFIHLLARFETLISS